MIDTRQLVDGLRTIESLAIIPRVASTNLIARRVVNECIENELSLPQALIIAREQFAGRGRQQRTWSSPAGKGIYATVLLTIAAAEMPVLPLATAVIIANYLRESFGLEARIKWPNDILVEGRKIAGILIEARLQQSHAYVLIGIGVNLEPVDDESRPNATSIRQMATGRVGDIDEVTIGFIHHIDAGVSRPLSNEQVLADWRALTVHRRGDPIACVVGDHTVEGTWEAIDDQGRALIRSGNDVTAVSAGDLILV